MQVKSIRYLRTITKLDRKDIEEYEGQKSDDIDMPKWGVTDTQAICDVCVLHGTAGPRN
jgi:hypothetical protein